MTLLLELSLNLKKCIFLSLNLILTTGSQVLFYILLACSSGSVLSFDNKSPRVRTTLIVGDSFAARLDPERLSKGRKKVINIAKGGNKFPDVINSVMNFCDNDSSCGLIVDQVFCSVGPNDIRKCRKEGVFKFKRELFKLT